MFCVEAMNVIFIEMHICYENKRNNKTSNMFLLIWYDVCFDVSSMRETLSETNLMIVIK